MLTKLLFIATKSAYKWAAEYGLIRLRRGLSPVSSLLCSLFITCLFHYVTVALILPVNSFFQ